MHCLEDALAIAHATQSQDLHPLLSLLEDDQTVDCQPTFGNAVENTPDLFSTLYIQKDGASRSFGGGAEVCIFI